MKYYQISFDKMKQINFSQLGPFLMNRVPKDDIIFHYIKSDTDGFTVLAANVETMNFAKEHEFTEISLAQDKNVKLNEVAIDVLTTIRSFLRRPGDEAILKNNSDLIIEMYIILKELFDLIGVPVDYWKRFLAKSDKTEGGKIRDIITASVTPHK
ncbi:MAG: hypothetical protein JSW11_21330 [Candidatus Heimdallarchaeota archaeon]|nr:MAG: hypothetical protein JSW11_21330 [Candidatus Heimdallarchaeota archaeon]